MKILSLVIFVIAMAVHLYASLKKDQKLRNCTKPFILLSLLAFYLLVSEKDALTVVLALIFSWLGDMLLMGKGTKWFAAGGVSFAVSHVCFVLSYMPDISFAGFSPAVAVLLMAVFIAAAVMIFSKLREYLPTALFYPMLVYLIINGIMNCSAILRFLSKPNPATLITCIGAMLFFISDSSLFFVRFNKEGRQKSHFLVMLTYSLGEFLIVAGLI